MRRLLIRLFLVASGLVVISVVAVVALTAATLAPQLPLPPFPTATPQPVAGPNNLVQASGDSAIVLTDLAYIDPAHPGATDSRCAPSGHWSLTVNPEAVVGRPFAQPPGMADWTRAAIAVSFGEGVCPGSAALTWFGHDPVQPSSDRWIAFVLASVATGVDGPTLRQYALRHVRQM